MRQLHSNQPYRTRSRRAYRHAQAARLAATLVLLMHVVVLAGCSGVRMNAEYSALLDRTAGASEVTARRALDGELTPEEMAAVLQRQARVWRAFQEARDAGRGREAVRP